MGCADENHIFIVRPAESLASSPLSLLKRETEIRDEAAWLESDKRAKEEAEARRRQRREERERKIAERKAKAAAKTNYERGER